MKKREGNRRVHVYFHADDFGMTKETTDRIAYLCRQGIVDSLGILPNGCLRYALDQVRELPLLCAVHVNLVEGPALSSTGERRLLTWGNGYMRHSFLGLLLLSVSPYRKQLYREVYEEIRCQLTAAREVWPENWKIGLDSHQHVHMIPLIYRAMMDAARDLRIPVSYMRIPVEPIWPYVKEVSLWHTYSAVNAVKVFVLRVLWQFIRRDFSKRGIKRRLFFGLLFSGRMDGRRVFKLLPAFVRIAEKKGLDVEASFHPGYLRRGEPFLDPYKESFQKFYLSPGRKIEFETLKRMGRKAR